MAERYEIDAHEPRGYIYGLHAGDGVIRYVGQTTRLKARMTEHVIHSRTKASRAGIPLDQWIRSIEVLHVTLLEQNVAAGELDRLEREWIVRLDMRTLFNRTTGGHDMPQGEAHNWFGRKHSAETRAKMRKGRELFTMEQVTGIRERVARGETRRAIAREFGVAAPTIEKMVKGVTYGAS